MTNPSDIITEIYYALIYVPTRDVSRRANQRRRLKGLDF